MSEKIPLSDRAAARILDVGSAIAVRFPRVIGKAFAPDGELPRRWFASATPASAIDWKSFPGEDASGYRPPHYKQGVVLQGSAADILQTSLMACEAPSVIRPAAAYALGGAVMATELEWLADDSQNVAAAFGIGRGTLYAQLGVFDKTTREFTQLPEVHVPVLPNEMGAILERFPHAQRV